MKRVVLFGLIIFLNLSLGYAQDMDHHPHDMDNHTNKQMTDEKAVRSEDNLGICPVMGGEARKEYSYTYQGKVYYFCCPSCIDEFKKDPEKYISKIKEFELEAYQFGFEPEEIVVEKGDIVRILARSRDVPHGVYIKEYNINVTVKKGETKKIEFIAKEAGEFPILCSVYCGRGHHSMKAKLIVK